MSSICLLIHGFTGGPHEVEPLRAYLAERKCITKTFILAGHGGTRKDMMDVSYQDWIAGADQELQELLEQHEYVHLIGFSTGALIAAHLSIRYPNRIRTLTLLSAPVFPLNPRQIMKTLIQPHMVRAYWRNLWQVPPQATREFYKIVHASHRIYKQINTPVFIVQAEQDHLVKPHSGTYLYNQLQMGENNKHLLVIADSGHLVCHCKDPSELFNAVYEWICRHASDQNAAGKR
ncbi:alpha/beta hydrolase [Paenibacillus shenyangensis]|uniref:alpha/beta hydrolase n=1 Tax=Paenibacillus sp. A9 TaxID=1284352 RepID=UPI0003730262|nr:alpha/beta fold hydrolase [Paenibacillus sp. A9]